MTPPRAVAERVKCEFLRHPKVITFGIWGANTGTLEDLAKLCDAVLAGQGEEREEQKYKLLWEYQTRRLVGMNMVLELQDKELAILRAQLKATPATTEETK